MKGGVRQAMRQGTPGEAMMAQIWSWAGPRTATKRRAARPPDQHCSRRPPRRRVDSLAAVAIPPPLGGRPAAGSYPMAQRGGGDA